ncbi:MAG: hypothetical protein KC656_12985 [Myxococcales bacterium]|nr:hypothetical protein [Myxococcales bacterium]
MDHREDLLAGRFSVDFVALGLRRRLAGDFGELLAHLAPREGRVEIDPRDLPGLDLGPGGRRAVGEILDDVGLLEDLGLEPQLDCIVSYARDERGLAVQTDVCSFHADRADGELDTWICTYIGPCTELLAPADARRRIEDPARRAGLLAASGLAEGPTFEAWLRDGSFDLHFEPREGALPVPLGVGELWRLAVDWPGAPGPPCVHRAPSGGPRLLLLA